MTHDWIHSLCSVLDRMESLYQRVLPLLDSERSALAALDYQKLYAELSQKDEILSMIRRLDRERLRFQDHFSALSGKPSSEITLRWIGEYLISLGGEQAELGTGLLARRERIEALVDEIKARIQRNGRFIEKSMQNIRKIAQNLSDNLGHSQESPEERVSNSHQVYTGKAKVKKSEQRPGTLVSKQL